ncbi:MAG: hypothetical protein C0623_07925, partial [Desulfuromonas sp.]
MKKMEASLSKITMIALNVVVLVAVLSTSAFAAAPTDITLSPSKVMDTTDTSGGYVIGSLSTTDADNPGDTFTYTIVGTGADDGVFSVSGSDLVLTDGTISLSSPNDNNSDGVYEVTVRTTDGTANTFDETLLVDIVPVYNPLIHSSLSTDSLKWSKQWGISGGKYGQFTCATCHSSDKADLGSNIKRIKTDITVTDGASADTFPIQQDGSSVPVAFLDAREGSSDLGDDLNRPDGAARSDKICEACHTYSATGTDGVKYHAYDMTSGDSGHYNQADCMVCHKHNEGFKPRACDSCHGYPPTANTLGGPTGLANDPYATASATAGAHQKHALDLGYACNNCHDGYVMPQESTAKPGFGDISISFNTFAVTTGSYSGQAGVSYNDVLGSGGQTCSTVYCHSDGKATPTYQTPSWIGAIGDCTSCHDEARAGTTLSGAHQAHMINTGTTIGQTLGCADCHTSTVSDNTTIIDDSIHVNKTVNVMDCSTEYCHSDGNTGNLIQKPPVWGNNYDCTSCHGDGSTKSHPDYISGGAGVDANSHVEHVETNSITCNECHSLTSTDGTSLDGTDSSQHVDGGIDVALQTGSFAGATDTCSATYCHGTTGTPVWGDVGSLDCGSCHSANNALEDSH